MQHTRDHHEELSWLPVIVPAAIIGGGMVLTKVGNVIGSAINSKIFKGKVPQDPEVK